jgi:hypothetical protein
VTFSTPTLHITHPVKEDVKKKFSPLSSEGGEACIQPLPASPHFLEGFWFFRFGSPRSSAAMPAPVADPDLMVSWSGGA